MTRVAEGERLEAPPEPRPRRSTDVVWVLALVCALGAVVASVLAAASRADREQAVYDWSPAAGVEDSLDVQPLLLTAGSAESITVTVGCAVFDQAGSGETDVLRTVDDVATHRGLALTASGGSLAGSVGDDGIFTVPDAAAACPVRFTLDGLVWRLDGATSAVSLDGRLEMPPRVHALITEVVSVAPGELRASVVTWPFRTSVAPMQVVLRVAAIVLVGIAVGLALVAGRAGRGQRQPAFSSRSWSAAIVHAAVVAGIAAWALAAPAFWDDGWVLVRQGNAQVAGAFVNYYDSWALPIPVGQWLEWVEAGWYGRQDHLVWARALPFVLVVGAWVTVAGYVRLLAREEGRRLTPLLAMAALVFSVGSTAWLMTLRPEPVVACLAGVSLVAAARFLQRPSCAPLAVITAAGALASTSHPAGLVVLAPMAAIAPSILRWIHDRPRPRAGAVAAIALAGAAVVLTLMFLAWDLQWYNELGALYGQAHGGQNWQVEPARWNLLQTPPNATFLRRLSAVLVLGCAVAYGTRLRGMGDALSDLPARSLGFALILLIATPSKWAIHFGTLTVYVATAATAELVRLLRESRDPASSRLRPFAIAVLLAVGAAWAWWYPITAEWNLGDLVTNSWTVGGEGLFPLSLARLDVQVAVVVLVVATVAVVLRWRNGRVALPRLAALSAVAMVPAVVLPGLTYTGWTLANDTADTPGWTLLQQNLEAATGDPGCGLGEQLVVPRWDAAAPLAVAGPPPALDAFAVDGVVPTDRPTGVPGLAVYGSHAPSDDTTGTFTSAWYELPVGQRTAMFVTGRVDVNNTVSVEFGRGQGAETETLETRGLGLVTNDLEWHLVEVTPTAGADRVRVVASDGTTGISGWVGFTAPIGYPETTIADLARGNGMTLLVDPQVATYFPCAQPPEVANGVASVPDVVLTYSGEGGAWFIAGEDKPFAGLQDLWSVERVSVTTTDGAPAPPWLAAHMLVGSDDDSDRPALTDVRIDPDKDPPVVLST